MVARCGVLIAGLYGMLALARFGWRMWERDEFNHFFYRLPYRSSGAGPALFALGWLGIIVVMPVVATLAGAEPPDLLRSAWWLPSLLLAVSAWSVVRAGKPPGTLQRFVRAAIEQGERLLAETTDDSSHTLSQARFCFTVSQRLLRDEPPSDDIVRAALGEATAYERMAASAPQAFEQAIASYEKAIETLRRMDRDASDVRLRLQAAQAALRQAPPASPPGEPPA